MPSLHTAAGEHKYLTAEERTRFLAAADRALAEARALCLTLAWSGARISEVLELTPNRVDLDGGALTFRSLKKRSATPAFWTVPVPPRVVEVLDLVFRVRQRRGTRRGDEPMFAMHRATAWRQVKAVLERAGITGAAARPKSFWHALGGAAVGTGVTLNMVQRWLGHAQLSTTSLYAGAVGEEERATACRLWE
ncbi:hypothetical protein [Azospirillum argentinense]